MKGHVNLKRSSRRKHTGQKRLVYSTFQSHLNGAWTIYTGICELLVDKHKQNMWCICSSLGQYDVIAMKKNRIWRTSPTLVIQIFLFRGLKQEIIMAWFISISWCRLLSSWPMLASSLSSWNSHGKNFFISVIIELKTAFELHFV